MTPDHAMTVIRGFIVATLTVTGPVLLVALVAGVMVGLVQTATQINEPSLSYLVKVGALILVLVVAGPALGAQVVGYMRQSLQSIAGVVH